MNKRTFHIPPHLGELPQIFDLGKLGDIRTTTLTEKDGSQWLHSYDSQAGVLKSKADPYGRATSFTYYADGSPKSKTGPKDVTVNLTTFYSYDAKGQQTSYQYNANLTRKEFTMRSLMRNVLMTSALVVCLYSHAAAAYNYPFKTLPPFEISTIDGYQETYNADEPITFTVEGKAQFDANPETGFSMAASIYDVPRTKNIQNGKIAFDATKQAWVVTFIAPRDNTKNYEIKINLYCGWDDRQCAQTYGVAAQIEKKLPLKIR